MIRTIIADDEVLVRMGLRTMINWEDYGYELVGEAGDGEKVLELCAHQQVDLVITDIKMPKLDGIGLIRAIQENYPHIKIVVLSCYKDSEYIKEAMRYHGALDYIFKLELERDELIKTLEKVKDVIGHSSDEGNPADQSQTDKEQFLKRWLEGENEHQGEIPFQIQLTGRFVCICLGLIRMSQKQFLSPEQEKEKRRNLKIWMVNTLEEGDFTYDLLELQQKYYIYLNLENDGSYRIQDVCTKIINTALMYWDFEVAAGVSSIYCGEKGIVQAYHQAEEAFDSFFVTPKPSIRLINECRLTHLQLEAISESEMHAALTERSLTAVEEKFQRYFDALEQSGEYKPSGKIKEEAFVQLSLVIRQIDRAFEGITVSGESSELMKKIVECDCLSQLRQVIGEYLERIQQELEHRQIVQISNEIQKAMEYIQEHYRQEISLREVAAYVGMNESYFSHLFKKSLQKNFITYLNEFRVKKAKELIRNSDVSLNLIAEKVGYGNYAYFSKVFKLITGINANDYRNQQNLKIVKMDEK